MLGTVTVCVDGEPKKYRVDGDGWVSIYLTAAEYSYAD